MEIMRITSITSSITLLQQQHLSQLQQSDNDNESDDNDDDEEVRLAGRRGVTDAPTHANKITTYYYRSLVFSSQGACYVRRGLRTDLTPPV